MKIACKWKNYTQIVPQTYSCLSIDISVPHPLLYSQGNWIFLCSTCFASSSIKSYRWVLVVNCLMLITTAARFLKKNGFVVAKRH